MKTLVLLMSIGALGEVANLAPALAFDDATQATSLTAYLVNSEEGYPDQGDLLAPPRQYYPAMVMTGRSVAIDHRRRHAH
jgi:hypothetical protein